MWREDGHVLRRALEFEGERLKMTWKKERMKAVSCREDALYRLKWIAGVNQIATGLR